MKYDYETLKRHCGEIAFRYEGRPVVITTKANYLKQNQPSRFYLLYDDNNALVRNGLKYGEVTKDRSLKTAGYPVAYGELPDISGVLEELDNKDDIDKLLKSAMDVSVLYDMMWRDAQ